jgi:hypothetical protein
MTEKLFDRHTQAAALPHAPEPAPEFREVAQRDGRIERSPQRPADEYGRGFRTEMDGAVHWRDFGNSYPAIQDSLHYLF